jgi:hypothetical protein
MIICDTDTPTVAVNQVGGDRKTFYIMKFNLTTRNPWLSIYLVSSKEIMIGTTNSGLSARTRVHLFRYHASLPVNEMLNLRYLCLFAHCGVQRLLTI